jgi:hypothetical protein
MFLKTSEADLMQNDHLFKIIIIILLIIIILIIIIIITNNIYFK